MFQSHRPTGKFVALVCSTKSAPRMRQLTLPHYCIISFLLCLFYIYLLHNFETARPCYNSAVESSSKECSGGRYPFPPCLLAADDMTYDGSYHVAYFHLRVAFGHDDAFEPLHATIRSKPVSATTLRAWYKASGTKREEHAVSISSHI